MSGFIIGTEMFIETKQFDAKSGKLVKHRPKKRNLTLDQGLAAWAKKAGTPNPKNFADSFLNCRLGSGNSAAGAVKIASGAITFTQATTTVTASAAFFTSDMVGALLKYGASGSGGIEQYITTFTDSTHVVVTSSQTQSAIAGVVWRVNLRDLETSLGVNTSTYQQNAGDNSTVFASNVVTYKRTFVFPVQGSSMTVNEIGWAADSTALGLFGKIVLPSSDVVPTSNFYVVIMTLAITFTPAAPTAVGNVGTNINTAGNAAIEELAVSTVGATGNSGATRSVLDGGISGTERLAFATATYTQRSAPSAGGTAFTFPTEIVTTTNGTWVYSGTAQTSTVGKMSMTMNGSMTTSGQSLFGMGFGIFNGSGTDVTFDVKFTATQTAPTGTFQPITVMSVTFGRTLVN